ncbi:hypothetical protein [Streptomyces sp. WM6378]|uniref:hypothetical protein n=1 Tax=Streptomyces sp. WM6378 TaxID=1415557 RepID=UPI0006AF17B7|nr:hypothetical protein [Streptomyces sp. WM6378]KOU33695.1 hypothetical protein ADK54_41770 [Streptomyces sp. WM6378]
MRRTLCTVTVAGLLAIPTIAFTAPAQAVSHGLANAQVRDDCEEHHDEESLFYYNLADNLAKIYGPIVYEEFREENDGPEQAANQQTQVNTGDVTQTQDGLVNVGLNNVLSQDEISAIANTHELLCGILNHIGILE